MQYLYRLEDEEVELFRKLLDTAVTMHCNRHELNPEQMKPAKKIEIKAGLISLEAKSFKQHTNLKGLTDYSIGLVCLSDNSIQAFNTNFSILLAGNVTFQGLNESEIKEDFKKLIKLLRHKVINKTHIFKKEKKEVIIGSSTAEDISVEINERSTNDNSYSVLNGTYKVFYHVLPTEEEFIIDEITLSSSSAANREVFAKYSHNYPNVSEPNTWSGEGTLNFVTGVLTIFLEGPESASRSNQKPLCLFIDLPVEETKSVDTLTGIVAGFRDFPKTGSVARLMAMVKIELFNSDNYDETILKNYFDYYRDRSWVRPPTTTNISQFKHLRSAIETSKKKKNWINGRPS